MNRWTIYDAATGQVLRSGSTSSKVDVPKPKEGERLLPSRELDGASSWVSARGVEDRPDLDCAGLYEVPASAVIANLPIGTKVKERGVALGDTIGELTIALNGREGRSIKLYPPFPYKPKEVRIIKTGRADRRSARAAERRAELIVGIGGLR